MDAIFALFFPSLQKSKFAVRPRVIEFALEKKEEGPYWDRLLAEKTKQHWLKVDFNKWKDEDESEDEDGGQNLEEVSASSSSLPFNTLHLSHAWGLKSPIHS